MEHKHAKLLRIAADNADQLFECDECEGGFTIRFVLQNDIYDWRPVKQTKKIKRWLWADKDGTTTNHMYSVDELFNNGLSLRYKQQLLWSETEFEVEE